MTLEPHLRRAFKASCAVAASTTPFSTGFCDDAFRHGFNRQTHTFPASVGRACTAQQGPSGRCQWPCRRERAPLHLGAARRRGIAGGRGGLRAGTTDTSRISCTTTCSCTVGLLDFNDVLTRSSSGYLLPADLASTGSDHRTPPEVVGIQPPGVQTSQPQ